MMKIFFILMEIQEQKIVSGCKNPSWTFYIAVMHSTVCGCLFLWKEQMQMKLVLAEKPSVAQSLAKVLLAKILSNPVLHLHREYCKLGFHFSIFSSIAVGFSHSKLLIWVGKHLTTTVNSGEHVWQLFNSSPKHGGGGSNPLMDASEQRRNPFQGFSAFLIWKGTKKFFHCMR